MEQLAIVRLPLTSRARPPRAPDLRREIPGGPVQPGFLAGEEAFRAWYDGALPRVYAYPAARCGGDRELAEELTQETFVAVVRQRHTFEGRSDPLTWVIGVARRRLVDHIRREVRRRRGLRRLGSNLELRGNPADSSPPGHPHVPTSSRPWRP